MGSNVMLFGWNRSIPGREEESGNHFDEFNGYLTALSEGDAIDNYQVIFLDNHGGDLNGFFLIYASNEKLDALCANEQWSRHVMRASLHLLNFGVVRGVANEAVMGRMELWNEMKP